MHPCISIRGSVCASVRWSVRSSVRNVFFFKLIPLINLRYLRPTHPFIHSLIPPFTCSSIHSFLHLLVHPFTLSSIHSFLQLLHLLVFDANQAPRSIDWTLIRHAYFVAATNQNLFIKTYTS